MPLNIKPSYRSIISFLGNYEIAEELMEDYLQRGVKFNFFSTSYSSAILDDINDAHTHHLTNESSLAFLKNKTRGLPKSHPFFNLLLFLAKEHFEFIRGRNILKIENIETFQFLHNTIDINPIYAMAISESIKDISHTQRISYIKFKTDNNSIEFPKRFSFLESFSDNHFHLGGANSFAYRLHSILQSPLSIDTSKLPQDKDIKILSNHLKFKILSYATSLLEKIIFSYILRNNKEQDNYKGINYTALFQKQFAMLSEGLLKQNIYTLQRLEMGLIDGVADVKSDKNENVINIDDIPPLFTVRPLGRSQDISFYIKDNYYNQLIYKIIKNNQSQNIQKADKVLWILLMEILRSHPNNLLKDSIYLYTVFRNILHTLIIQQQKGGGLEYFSSYSQSSVRRAKKEHEFVDSFRSILSSNYRMNIEGRINFQDTPKEYADEMTKWLKAFTSVKEESKGECDYEDNISFIFHFQKKDEDKKFPIYSKVVVTQSKHYHFRKELFIKARAFLNFMKSSKYRKVPIFIKNNKSNIANYIIDHRIRYSKIKIEKLNLLNHISGIDAASREDKVPPEVFAPVYRYIRNSLELSMLPFDHNIPSAKSTTCHNKLFQFSYHVGEEFRDLTTGIRHIFEAIIFLGFRKGDRLGHALALGMNPKKYISNHKVAITSKAEQFDNAVFCYYILDTYSKDVTLKHDFYQKAMNLGSDIYRGNYTIDNYINAWLLRRNSPISLKKFLDTYKAYSSEEDYNHSINDKFSSPEQEKHFYYNDGRICAFASQNKDDIDFIDKNHFLLTLHRVLHQDKLYFKMSLPDIYNVGLSFNDKVCNRYAWASKDPKAWELFLRYSLETKTRKRGNIQVDIYSANASSIEQIQDIIMEEFIARRDIVIEVMPTSNILNSDLYSYKHHPLFRFNPVDKLDEFNSYDIRKTKLRTIINTDNPGFQSTSYINELFLILQAGTQKGYSTEKMEKYLKEIIELGNLIYSGKASQE